MNEIIPMLGMGVLLAAAGWRLRVWTHRRRLSRGYRILRAMKALDEYGGYLSGVSFKNLVQRLEAFGQGVDGVHLAHDLPWLEQTGNVTHWKEDGVTLWKLTSKGEDMCELPY